jgi:hypothetical protein
LRSSTDIDDLTPERLAQLAIASVGTAERGEDCIIYLINARKYGIETALPGAYATEILRRTMTGSLGGALQKVLAG